MKFDLSGLLKIKKLQPKPISGNKFEVKRQIKQEMRSRAKKVQEADTLKDLLYKDMEI